MSRESSLWKTVKNNMKDKWEATRVENNISLGTPDVYYTIIQTGTMGWIELKHKKQWPKREKTKIKIDHFTPQQRNFLKNHGKLGANVFMLLQVDRDYLLFDWTIAKDFGTLDKVELIDRSILHWENHIDYNELESYLNGIIFTDYADPEWDSKK